MRNSEQEIWFAGAGVLCALVGLVPDLRERRIPNWITGTSAVIALGCHLLTGGWSGLGGSVLAGLMAGGVLFFFFLVGGMGAGDVKLMTSVGCFLGVSLVGCCLLSTALCGAALGIAVSLKRGKLQATLSNAVTLFRHHRETGLTPHHELNIHNANALRMPFALPIAAGCLITFGSRVWGF